MFIFICLVSITIEENTRTVWRCDSVFGVCMRGDGDGTGLVCLVYVCMVMVTERGWCVWCTYVW